MTSIVQAALLSYAYTATLVVASRQFASFYFDDPLLLSARPVKWPDEPLLLTPLIDAGELVNARNLSQVSTIYGIKSYSGYLTVNKTSKSHLFFWYFPKTTPGNDNFTTPLILWLQGGPGTSSVYGMFLENGPLEVTNSKKREITWTNHYHMLYIDQPVGTGFSFTDANGYVSTEEQLAEHLYEALRQFYQLFTELMACDFYIAGESYAGKFIPALGHKIHLVNRQPSSAYFKIPLKGMMIGNGYLDTETQYDYASHLYVLGMIDEGERSELEEIQNRVKEYVRSHRWSEIANEDHRLFRKMREMLGPVSKYDYTKDDLEHTNMKLACTTRLEEDLFGRFVHAGSRTFVNRRSEWIDAFRQQDTGRSVRPWVEELLEHYPMLFYNGQLDITLPHTFTEHFLDSLCWSGASEYNRTRKQIWRVSDESAAGYYKAVGNLVYILVLNAGHYVPAAQPNNTLTMIDLFIKGEFKTVSMAKTKS